MLVSKLEPVLEAPVSVLECPVLFACVDAAALLVADEPTDSVLPSLLSASVGRTFLLALKLPSIMIMLTVI